jgi:hypothetical protein
MRERRSGRVRLTGPSIVVGLACAGFAAWAMAGCPAREVLPTEVPVFPGAVVRASESAFQQKLLQLLGPAASSPPTVEVYETPAAFAAVADFYEPFFGRGGFTRQRFVVASRLREIAAGAGAGGRQQLAVGRLLFRGSGADSLSQQEVSDSLTAVAERFADVEGLVALGRIELGTSPPSEALVSIERPHLSAETLSVDS